MSYAADLKLGFHDLTKSQKDEVVEEIVHILRLDKAMDTDCKRLSGGELKRLSIAQELLNNPPILFLDEPTTGLDDLSGSQCVELLRRLAHGGRTVICSIHTPSAKIFEMFDHIYVVANGQCIYQGEGMNIVPYMETVGIRCPKTYNPADFSEFLILLFMSANKMFIFQPVIEVACGEYGNEFPDRMVEHVDNGRVRSWKPSDDIHDRYEKLYNFNDYQDFSQFDEEINPNNLKFKCSSWEQFTILFRRISKQIYRNKVCLTILISKSCSIIDNFQSYLAMRFYMHIFLGFVIGGLFYQMGNDATKTLFNFGFCFTIIIAFLYIPMMPVLLECKYLHK